MQREDLWSRLADGRRKPQLDIQHRLVMAATKLLTVVRTPTSDETGAIRTLANPANPKPAGSYVESDGYTPHV